MGHEVKFAAGTGVGAAETLAEALAAAYERTRAHDKAWGNRERRPRLKGRERVDGKYAEQLAVSRG